VPWQIALWDLAPITMNSMFQPNGMVLSFPSAWGVALRSSPIFCLFDGLDLTHFCLILIVFNGDNPRQAARRIARVRFDDVDDETSDGSLTTLRKRFWIVNVIFVLSTLLAAIKILSFRGTAGVQSSAVCYLYSYLISSALILAAGPDSGVEGFAPTSSGIPSTKADRIARRPTLVTISYSGNTIPLHVARQAYIWDPTIPRALQ
jgi:hypothetical protein